ncbi:hypothetical protein [Dermatophilus congolensis]|uniref:hypothetical protein n=1 Tax=Dermatophilus congolensis TaxID=1863 RepID=UPI001AAED049|nr:hypothetical protein [Dermatophilus congolensis]MBO3143327.1 hypothetical protein [Dermatophilus congolensis]MBO3152314.1 hypothetical protein [Dermatophilus congolensis]MBO3160673.1 hypothetical protein [Dermatophilus congolensis]MBO3163603.1 hypothetical protein [Dermatophilus congolensis]MBO3177149.1 hypothetical protein [Dermatophilus congolensis]
MVTSPPPPDSSSAESGKRSIKKVGRRRAVSSPPGKVDPIIDPTTDDQNTPVLDVSSLSERERWILSQRPPHWG